MEEAMDKKQMFDLAERGKAIDEIRNAVNPFGEEGELKDAQYHLDQAVLAIHARIEREGSQVIR